MMFDHFETEITCEEVYPDEFLDLAFAVGASHFPDPDDDILDDDDDDGDIIADLIIDPDFIDGGLTADAQNYLADQDSRREFV
jgi:hypothetical protein